MAEIAIIGATGMVGRQMLESLESSSCRVDRLYLYASKRSEGVTMTFRGTTVTVRALSESSIEPSIDYALFSAGGETARAYAHIMCKHNIVMIDNSSAWRMDPEVPLIVPEVNKAHYRGEPLIANPNCSTIQAVVPLYVIGRLFGLKRVAYTTYQSVSGSGRKGIDALDNPSPEKGHISDNVIPQIDVFETDGYTKEEHKMIHETRKILLDESLPVTATCVRVPVSNAHAVAINVTTKTPVDIEVLKRHLNHQPGIILTDTIEDLTPKAARDQDAIIVGRIRPDESLENTIHLWTVADNLRKGAATNAVQILKTIMEGQT